MKRSYIYYKSPSIASAPKPSITKMLVLLAHTQDTSHKKTSFSRNKNLLIRDAVVAKTAEKQAESSKKQINIYFRVTFVIKATKCCSRTPHVFSVFSI